MSFMKKSGNAAGLTEAVLDSGRDFIDYDPVGLPDEGDVKNIWTIIRNFEKARPGMIAAFVEQAKKERLENTHQLYAVKQFGPDKATRRVLTMPTPLLRDIEEAYPLMFRNKRHLAWFRKNFPMFNTR